MHHVQIMKNFQTSQEQIYKFQSESVLTGYEYYCKENLKEANILV